VKVYIYVPWEIMGVVCSMANIRRTWNKSLNPHCEIVILESGKKIVKFWADKTFRNLFERIAFEGDL